MARRSVRPRLNLTEYECEMLDGMAAIMKLRGRRRGRAPYGETLLAFFRLVLAYAEDHRGSDFTLEIGKMIERSGLKRKYVRRSLLPAAAIKAERRYHLDGQAPHLERESYTPQEAHELALLMEATRLLKEANRVRKSKRRKRL